MARVFDYRFCRKTQENVYMCNLLGGYQTRTSDVWAMGITFFEMVAHEHPFSNKEVQIQARFSSPGTAGNSWVPPRLSQILQILLKLAIIWQIFFSKFAEISPSSLILKQNFRFISKLEAVQTCTHIVKLQTCCKTNIYF